MKTLLFSLLLFTGFISTNSKEDAADDPAPKNASEPAHIQVAILLDVSGSMDGLIEQAKSQLWSMVETLGKASCNGEKPVIEIALYEYGRPKNGASNNFIKRLSSFSADMDSLSAKLFSLHTDGGDEYCGAVMVQSLNDLGWNTNPGFYKVIFIAGNESFRQGSVDWTAACALAKQKGVIINTIYCGDKENGIAEYWNLMGECGSGNYSNIDQNQKEDNIPAPQDSMIYVFNNKLNGNYIAYNSVGQGRLNLQASMDKANASIGYATMAKRAKVKASRTTYNNAAWDLVDAAKADSAVFDKLDKDYLPDSLKNKSKAEIKQYVQQKDAERSAIQKQLTTLITEREAYISAVRKTRAQNSNVQNLDNAIQQIIRSQAVKYNIRFEE